MSLTTKKSATRGIMGGLLLLIFYFVVLSLANSPTHALEQFQLLWYWILTLTIGFAIQVGFWSYIRLRTKEQKLKSMTGEVATTGGISAGSMIACCAHHLIDVLPILGASVVFLFLAQYQIFFLVLGVVSNIIGIVLMLGIIQKHSLFEENGILKQLMKFNSKKVKGGIIAASLLVLVVSFFWIRNDNTANYPSSTDATSPKGTEISTKEEVLSLPTRINDESGLSIEVDPVGFRENKPIEFEISFDTHQGDLSFDLAKQSFLIDGQDNKYLPTEWQGKSGGHHLAGKLIFPSLTEKTDKMKLIIENIYGVEERIFAWDL